MDKEGFQNDFYEITNFILKADWIKIEQICH